jgi:hypothetical protein
VDAAARGQEQALRGDTGGRSIRQSTGRASSLAPSRFDTDGPDCERSGALPPARARLATAACHTTPHAATHHSEQTR